MYLALVHWNFDSSFAKLTECLTHVKKWMDGVNLKLNPEKTEFIITGEKHAKESLVQKLSPSVLEILYLPYQLN